MTGGSMATVDQDGKGERRKKKKEKNVWMRGNTENVEERGWDGNGELFKGKKKLSNIFFTYSKITFFIYL